jgi:hypothetical protein
MLGRRGGEKAVVAKAVGLGSVQNTAQRTAVTAVSNRAVVII